jgi:hypothetical protein
MHVDFFTEVGIYERVLNVQLVYLHVVNTAHGTEQSEACVLHDWGKSLGVVDTLNLTATIDDEASLVSHHFPVFCLLLEHEVTPQDPLMSSWKWDKFPAPPLFLQGCNLLLHGPFPVQPLLAGQGCPVRRR